MRLTLAVDVEALGLHFDHPTLSVFRRLAEHGDVFGGPSGDVIGGRLRGVEAGHGAEALAVDAECGDAFHQAACVSVKDVIATVAPATIETVFRLSCAPDVDTVPS